MSRARPRRDRTVAHRHPEDSGSLVIAHAFQANQQNHLALRFGQFGNRMVEFHQMETGCRIGRRGPEEFTGIGDTAFPRALFGELR